MSPARRSSRRDCGCRPAQRRRRCGRSPGCTRPPVTCSCSDVSRSRRASSSARTGPATGARNASDALMRFASARSVRIHVARSGGVMPRAASRVRATPTSDEKADSQSCRSARAIACRRSRDSNSFSALRCMRPTRGSAAVTTPSSTVTWSWNPGLATGWCSSSGSWSSQGRRPAVPIPMSRSVATPSWCQSAGRRVRGRTSTSCRARRQRSTLRDVSTSGPPRLRVGIVGSGRVGAVLGAALRRAGHDGRRRVRGVGRVAAAGRRAACPACPCCRCPRWSPTPTSCCSPCPDDVLPGLVADSSTPAPSTRASSWRTRRAGTARTSSSRRDASGPAAGDPPRDDVHRHHGRPARLADCPFGVTSPDAVRPVAEALVVEMGGEPVWVPEEARALYHAAVVFGANYLMTVVLQSLELLREAGIAEPAAADGAAAERVARQRAAARGRALTGPVARGDARTVADHLQRLSTCRRWWATPTVALARLTADRALARRAHRPGGRRGAARRARRGSGGARDRARSRDARLREARGRRARAPGRRAPS